MKIKDPDYLNWIRKQPCHECGYKPTGYWRYILDKSSTWADKYKQGRYAGSNAAHHTGDGVSSPRSRDDLTIPMCDLATDIGAYNNCHHVKAHGHKKSTYRQQYRDASLRYRTRYLDMSSTPTPPVEVPVPVTIPEGKKKPKEKEDGNTKEEKS